MRRRVWARDGGTRRVCRGQDVGDGVWPVVAALLPRAAQLQVRFRQWGLGWRRDRDSVARLAAAHAVVLQGLNV